MESLAEEPRFVRPTVIPLIIKNFMRRLIFFFVLLSWMSVTAGAETLPVRHFRHCGPFPVQTPFLVDSVNVQSAAFDAKSLLDAPLSKADLADSDPCTWDAVPSGGNDLSVGWLSFDFENSRFATVTVSIKGDMKNHRLFVDGKPAKGPVKLDPGTHRAEIKYLLDSGEKPTLDAIRSAVLKPVPASSQSR